MKLFGCHQLWCMCAVKSLLQHIFLAHRDWLPAGVLPVAHLQQTQALLHTLTGETQCTLDNPVFYCSFVAVHHHTDINFLVACLIRALYKFDIVMDADGMRAYFLPPRFYSTEFPYAGLKLKMVRRIFQSGKVLQMNEADAGLVSDALQFFCRCESHRRERSRCAASQLPFIAWRAQLMCYAQLALGMHIWLSWPIGTYSSKFPSNGWPTPKNTGQELLFVCPWNPHNKQPQADLLATHSFSSLLAYLLQDTPGHPGAVKVLCLASDPHLLWSLLCEFARWRRHSIRCHICYCGACIFLLSENLLNKCQSFKV